MTTTTITIDQLKNRYDQYCEVECVDHVFGTMGKRHGIGELTWTLDDDDSIEIASDNLMGWSDYSHHIVIRTRVGNISIFARLK